MYKNDLLKTNVKSKCISNSILVCGSCIPIEHPQILDQFKEYTVLYACLEEEHINKLSWKLCTIVRINKPKKITVLTMDGSPHCIQMHYSVEDIKKIFPDLDIEHYVIENGRLHKITSKAIVVSRHLSEVEGII